ncbi:MAG: hypothetical protein CL932_21230 [Deltaproteobacteria bacterium]|nr:hypothetical protein [Deltaproteobacteria bacterium]
MMSFLSPRMLIQHLCLTVLLVLIACSDPPKKEGCENNNDCAVQQVCKDTQCTDIVCSTNDDCRGGYLCDTTSQRCQANSENCPELATGGCCKDEHCKADEQCVEKACQKKSCEKNEDCTETDKPKCLEGTCSPADTCKQDSDCQTDKPKCENGTCTALPLKKSGEECAPNAPCEKDLVCFAEIGQTYCRKQCDPFNAVCGIGTVCQFINETTGACVPRNSGKRDGEACDAAPCEKSFTCVEWPAGSSVCARPCRNAKDDCGQDEICHDFGSIKLCLAKPQSCGTGRPCPDKWTCTNDVCLPDKCPTVACQTGEICRLGNCEKPNCCKGDVCPSSTTCNHSTGACVTPTIDIPFCTACLSNGSCGLPSERCIALTSAQDRICAAECTATKTCTDNNMACIKQKDDRWFCLPKVGTCDRKACDGVTCKDNEACLPLTKKCVAVGLGVCKPCVNDLQCGGPTDLCIIKEGETTGYCAQDCAGCAQCPAGTACQDYNGQKQCLSATSCK